MARWAGPYLIFLSPGVQRGHYLEQGTLILVCQRLWVAQVEAGQFPYVLVEEDLEVMRCLSVLVEEDLEVRRCLSVLVEEDLVLLGTCWL